MKPNKTSDYTGLFLLIVSIAVIVFFAIDKCNNQPKDDNTERLLERAKGAEYAAWIYEDSVIVLNAVSKQKDAIIDSLSKFRTEVAKDGAKSREKLRSLPKEEQNRIADSTFGDSLHLMALIFADSTKQLHTENVICDSTNSSLVAKTVNLEVQKGLLLMANDSLKVANGIKDGVISDHHKQLKQAQRKGYFKGLKHGGGIGFVAGYIAGKLRF